MRFGLQFSKWFAILGMVVATATIANSASAADIEDISDERFFTVFNDTGSNSVAGEVYAPSEEQNPIGTVANFGDVGRVAFQQFPPVYLVNPNAWAFAGPGRGKIDFKVGMKSVSIVVRGTAAGEVPGPDGVFPFPGTNNGGAEDFSYDESDAVVFAVDKYGRRIRGTKTKLQNVNLQGDEIKVIRYDASELGAEVHGLVFKQKSGSENAAIFLGGLGVTPNTVAQFVRDNGNGFDDNPFDYDILRAALDEAELTSALDDPFSDVTLFAPNDRAFIRLANDLGADVESEEEALNAIIDALGLEVVADTLLYHVSGERIGFFQLALRAIFRIRIETFLEGVKIRPRLDHFYRIRLRDREPDLANPAVVFPIDVQAGNGVVQTINRVLIPADLDN